MDSTLKILNTSTHILTQKGEELQFQGLQFQANCRNKFQAILKFIEPFHSHFCGRKFSIMEKKKKPYLGSTLSGIRNTEHQLAKH